MIALKNILVATDFGEAADVAFMYGRTLARSFGATLHVLHVTPDVYQTAFAAETFTTSSPDLQNQIDEDARRRLTELLIDNDGSSPAMQSELVMSNSPGLAIVEFAKHKGIDMIVMGTHGRGPLAHLMMGNVAERVVRLAPCPVLTVRHPEHEFVHPDALTTVAHA